MDFKFVSFKLLLLLLSLISCQNSSEKQTKKTLDISGNLIIFHAGSLAVPLQKIAGAFEKEYPGTKVLTEAAGSVECARKITDLGKPCDLLFSSDYRVIEKFLVPEFTSWYLPFAGNEMVIAFTDGSRGKDDITSGNWPEILSREDIRFGRADPDSDPCGYRTLMVMELAGIYYEKKEIFIKLSLKDRQFIRPKEVELLALLELRELDFIFIYRSVAVQHGLLFMELPDEINLKKPEMNEYYGQSVIYIKGHAPAEKTAINGEAITYAVTMPDNASNPEAAKVFLDFLLDDVKGMKILKESGHNSLLPVSASQVKNLPAYLKIYTSN
jgi:molybdate/tungstate transport system substrate-binding protein